MKCRLSPQCKDVWNVVHKDKVDSYCFGRGLCKERKRMKKKNDLPEYSQFVNDCRAMKMHSTTNINVRLLAGIIIGFIFGIFVWIMYMVMYID